MTRALYSFGMEDDLQTQIDNLRSAILCLGMGCVVLIIAVAFLGWKTL